MASAHRWRSARVYLRAFREARAYWPYLLLVLVLGLAGTPLALLGPLPLKIVLDNVIGTDPLPSVLAWAVPSRVDQTAEAMLMLALAVAVVTALLGAVHQAFDWLVREYVAERMVVDFRSKLLLHALHGSAQAHHERGSHEPAYRINLDAPALQWTALYGVIPVIVSLVSLTGMLYVTSVVAPQLALVALGTAVPMVLLIHLNQHRMRDQWHGVRENESAAQSVVQEALRALRVVTVFGQQRFEQRRFVGHSMSALASRIRVIRLEGAFTLLLGLTTTVGTVAVLYLGVREVQAGAMTAGTLILVMGYIAQLYAPLQAIGNHITGQQRAIAAAERAFAMLDEEPAVKERADARTLVRAQGDVELEGVGFTYPDNAQPVFSDTSLFVPAGRRVGVVGRSGAGKSTFINLLIRLFDPDQGRIRLDGVDLRDYRLADLRNQFSVVSQEVVLFSGTIAENIAYGRPDASEEEVRAAARMSDAAAFIEALPDGYRTRVGEQGMRLSGGERQRIALARAFLKNAPILLLDEPTSALDRDTEAAITDALEHLMAGRTVFIITHRESILRDVDMVLRVGDGRIEAEEPQPAPEWRWAS